MTNTNRPAFNLDLDLLRTFVAVADLKTFAAAASSVDRTQSAVSQQMQRLEQLTGKELFSRQGRNKSLTEHGIQLLGYARKILRFNDEACNALLYDNVQGKLTIGAADDTSDTILPFLLNRITSMYPGLAIDVQIKRDPFIMAMLHQGDVDLVLTTSPSSHFASQTLRTSPTLWYCSADYLFQPEEIISLVLLDEPDPYRDMAIQYLDEQGREWKIAYVASTLAAARAAVKAGLGIMVHPIEMMSSDLRVLGRTEGMPELPDTAYRLCHNVGSSNHLANTIFNALQME